MVHHHLVLGCTRHEQEANCRLALGNILSPPQHQNLPLHLQNNPPPTPRPPPVSPQHCKWSWRCKKRQADTSLQVLSSNSNDNLFASALARDAQLWSANFAFDMPGAGPSNAWPQPARRLDEDEPFWFFNDKWDGNVLIDSNSDDGRPEGPTLAAGAAWIKGLTAAGTLSQELEAEIACTGDEDMKTIQGFNYKVDTDMSARMYNKLPWAFPDKLGDHPKHHALCTCIA
ncbi:hypothetical protein FRC11_005537 [Ceratobasidium sp. 423]|nr:hypothetical protein FRC11_005537 [Ceratobasidium sp. 423]